MTVFYIGLGIVFAGLGAVGWIMYNEKKELDGEETLSSGKDEETATNLLNRVGLPGEGQALDFEGKESFTTKLLKLLRIKKEDEPSEFEDRPHLHDIPQSNKDEIGTVSMTTHPELKPEHEEPDSDLSEQPQFKQPLPPLSDNPSYEEKYKRLEALLEEKNQELDKTHKTLVSEIKNRKDFNKVKDLLEKELKDNKDKARKTQVELTGAQAEITSYKKRIDQLEQKVTKVEKELLAVEDEIKEKDKLIKELSESKAAPQETKPEETAQPDEPSQIEETPDNKPAQPEEAAQLDEPTQVEETPQEEPPTEEPAQAEEAPQEEPPTEEPAQAKEAPQDETPTEEPTQPEETPQEEPPVKESTQPEESQAKEPPQPEEPPAEEPIKTEEPETKESDQTDDVNSMVIEPSPEPPTIEPNADLDLSNTKSDAASLQSFDNPEPTENNNVTGGEGGAAEGGEEASSHTMDLTEYEISQSKKASQESEELAEKLFTEAAEELKQKENASDTPAEQDVSNNASQQENLETSDNTENIEKIEEPSEPISEESTQSEEPPTEEPPREEPAQTEEAPEEEPATEEQPISEEPAGDNSNDQYASLPPDILADNNNDDTPEETTEDTRDNQDHQATDGDKPEEEKNP